MQLHYKTIGEGSRPLVLLHGLFGSLDNWLTLSKSIAALGYTVYLLDQRNHGRSPHSEQFGYEEMADDLAEFIEQQQLTNPVLLGHSMGGKTIMHYAITRPEAPIHKLVVVDMAPRAYAVHHSTILDGLNAIPMATLESRQQADDLLATYEPSVSVRQFLLKNLYRTESGTFAWRFNLPVLTAQIEKVGIATPQGSNNVPALFLRGENSSYVRNEDEALIRSLFPQAQLQTVPNAGHWIHAEQPVAFMRALESFL
jgi:pimeloyl-ACP methyl ester carboxylesterase